MAVTGKRIFLVGEHGIVGHAGKKIVRLIILAHMLDAVVPASIDIGALGREIRRLFLAACPLADRPVILGAAIFARFDTNAVEKW
jgi:hypothetical protein